jgi:hypothetical protein
MIDGIVIWFLRPWHLNPLTRAPITLQEYKHNTLREAPLGGKMYLKRVSLSIFQLDSN